MTTLLHIDTSIFSAQGESSRLAQAFVDQWRDSHPGAAVIKRDLALQPIPHLDAAGFQAFIATPELRSEAQKAVVAYSDVLIDELKRADVIALGLPLYNFGVPSMLKAYFDHVARAGVTFRYTERGPIGLLTGKEAFVFAARGGKYFGTTLDTQTAYVRDFWRFLGIGHVHFIYAEGLALGAGPKQIALSQPRGSLQATIAMRPEPRSTRLSSRSTRVGCMERWSESTTVMASKRESGNGSSSSRPTWNSPCGLRRRAVVTCRGEGSTPTTLAPIPVAMAAMSPRAQPASSRCSPRCRPMRCRMRS